tara:strand:- start:102 stop:731 length:630 start_codon:yes stop_codon:yes gene_type:complete
MSANIFDINMQEENCVICQEPLESAQTYQLPECKHTYHTHCIVTWFRHRPSSEDFNSPDGKCPCCGNRGINNHNSNISTSAGGLGSSMVLASARRRARLGWRYRPNREFRELVKILRNYEKEHEGPKQLTTLLKKWDDTRKDVTTAEENLRDFTKKLKTESCNYVEAQKKKTAFLQKIYNKRSRFRDLSMEIKNFPIVPIIIPTPIDIN